MKLKSVDKKISGDKDILCQQKDSLLVDNSLPSDSLRHEDCDIPSNVPPRKNLPVKQFSSSPVNNFPTYGQDYDGGMPDAVTLEIFALRRRNAEQQAKIETLNNKITKAIECITSQRRFLKLWLEEGQGESYDKLQGRIKGMQAMVDHLENRNIGYTARLETPERWKAIK